MSDEVSLRIYDVFQDDGVAGKKLGTLVVYTHPSTTAATYYPIYRPFTPMLHQVWGDRRELAITVAAIAPLIDEVEGEAVVFMDVAKITSGKAEWPTVPRPRPREGYGKAD